MRAATLLFPLGLALTTIQAPQEPQQLLPGVLPDAASDEARRAWKELCEGTLAATPIRDFDLKFDLRTRDESNRTHDVGAHIRFLGPKYLWSMIAESGQGHVRNDEGDFLLDGKTGEAVKLIGREGAEDIRQIDETIAIARNFVALTDPRSVRIAALERVGGPPPILPPKLASSATRLSWLAVESPDLRLYRLRSRAGEKEPLVRALLGIDPQRKRIELALIHEDLGDRPLLGSTLLVDLSGHFEKDGFVVPRRIDVYQVDTEVEPWCFRAKPSSVLSVKNEDFDLRPDLKPEDFAIGR